MADLEPCRCGHEGGLHPMLDWDTGQRGRCLASSGCACPIYQPCQPPLTPEPVSAPTNTLRERLVLALVAALTEADPLVTITIGETELRINFK